MCGVINLIPAREVLPGSEELKTNARQCRRVDNLCQITGLFFFKDLFIYLFMAVLHLCCCEQPFSGCREEVYSLVSVRGLLFAVASLWGAQALGHVGFSK